MSNPVIILVVGMPGVGKTTVIRLAAQQFARLGLKTATLDIDRFSRLFLDDYMPEGILNPTLKERISFILEGLKLKAMRALSTGENFAAHPQAKEAVKTWVRKQAVDIIFLELHWPRTIIHYSYHELWLVTAPPAKSLRQLLALQLKPKNPVKQKPEDKLEQKPEDQGLKPEDQEYKTEDQVLLRIKAGYAAAQALWGRSFQVLPKEKFFISKSIFDE
ncbi:MAG TPA: hypothetical protein PLR08_00680 [bacterium]|nr:hypothetical protein [bacterium]